jgi:hypothetical protein
VPGSHVPLRTPSALGLTAPPRALPLSTARPIPSSWAHPEPQRPAPGRQAADETSLQESANWSGYIDAGTGAKFTEVRGTWAVPGVANLSASGDSSTWVGIDGTTTGDLIQAGTEQDWGVEGELYYAWYEILPGSTMYLGEVFPGDQISAEVAHVGTASWTITIEDSTQHIVWAGAVTYRAPGSSAEWVEEAPTNGATNSLFPLADFGAVRFSGLGVRGPGTATAKVSPVYMTAGKRRHIVAYPDQYSSGTNSFDITYGAPPSSPVSFPGVPVATAATSTSTTTTTAAAVATTAPSPVASGPGYWLAGIDGGVFSFGSAGFHGSVVHLWPKPSDFVPITGIAPTPDGRGYWLVNVLGGVFTFGDAVYAGSLTSMSLVQPDIIGIAATADGKGYFMLSATGSVYAFGDAHFKGSCGTPLAGCRHVEATALVLDSTGQGYWILLANCKMIAFGDAPDIPDADCQAAVKGGGQPAAARTAARTPDGRGYWVLLLNGVVFPEGDAKTLGSWISPIATGTTDPAEAFLPTSDGKGGWIVVANGTVAPCGDAPTLGDTKGTKLNAQIFSATGW